MIKHSVILDTLFQSKVLNNCSFKPFKPCKWRLFKAIERMLKSTNLIGCPLKTKPGDCSICVCSSR